MSELPPTRLWGAVGSSVHTTSFNCFVSTARRGFLWSVWSTLVYLGDPGVDKDLKVYCRVVYAKHLKKQKVYAAHKDLSRALSEMGESGYTLHEAVESVFSIWFRYGAIQQAFLETWMHTGIVNEDAPLPSWLPE